MSLATKKQYYAETYGLLRDQLLISAEGDKPPTSSTAAKSDASEESGGYGQAGVETEVERRIGRGSGRKGDVARPSTSLSGSSSSSALKSSVRRQAASQESERDSYRYNDWTETEKPSRATHPSIAVATPERTIAATTTDRAVKGSRFNRESAGFAIGAPLSRSSAAHPVRGEREREREDIVSNASSIETPRSMSMTNSSPQSKTFKGEAITSPRPLRANSKYTAPNYSGGGFQATNSTVSADSLRPDKDSKTGQLEVHHAHCC